MLVKMAESNGSVLVVMRERCVDRECVTAGNVCAIDIYCRTRVRLCGLHVFVMRTGKDTSLNLL